MFLFVCKQTNTHAYKHPHFCTLSTRVNRNKGFGFLRNHDCPRGSTAVPEAKGDYCWSWILQSPLFDAIFREWIEEKEMDGTVSTLEETKNKKETAITTNERTNEGWKKTCKNARYECVCVRNGTTTAQPFLLHSKVRFRTLIQNSTWTNFNSLIVYWMGRAWWSVAWFRILTG